MWISGRPVGVNNPLLFPTLQLPFKHLLNFLLLLPHPRLQVSKRSVLLVLLFLLSSSLFPLLLLLLFLASLLRASSYFFPSQATQSRKLTILESLSIVSIAIHPYASHSYWLKSLLITLSVRVLCCPVSCLLTFFFPISLLPSSLPLRTTRSRQQIAPGSLSTTSIATRPSTTHSRGPSMLPIRTRTL